MLLIIIELLGTIGCCSIKTINRILAVFLDYSRFIGNRGVFKELTAEILNQIIMELLLNIQFLIISLNRLILQLE